MIAKRMAVRPSAGWIGRMKSILARALHRPGTYRPELYYMRGPGPKARAKQDRPTAAK
jgi:hypothetical protein